ncbi:MAG: hypothetical protein ACK5NK_03005 [Niabella sp.]
MKRGLLLVIFITAIIVLAFTMQQTKSDEEKPAFLINDKIAQNHYTKVSVSFESLYKPDTVLLQHLKNDYSNIWAHLNHLFQTNDVVAGKEYYTEDWFKKIIGQFNGVVQTGIIRKDVQHQLHVKTWTPDGLLCAAIDSNVVLQYNFPDGTQKTSIANLAVVLLLQGDHWRLDALRIINETSPVTL